MTKSRIPLEKFVKEYSVRNKLNEDIPVYSVTNSQGFCTEYFSKEVASQDKTTYKIVPRGYFAYNPSRINVGSVDWQKYEDRVIVSPLYNVFSVSDEIDCQYLYYFFRSNIGRQMIKAKSSGSVRDNLKIEMLKEMTIPDISMREQQFCSSVLDKLQILIKLKFDEIKQMDELVKARFVEMFGDPVINSKNLATKELKNVMALKAGDFTVASDILDEPSESNPYPCYGGNGVRGYVAEYNQEGEYSLIGRQGALSGNVQYVNGKFKNTEHALLVTPLVEINSIWLNQLLLNLDLKRYQTGAAQPGISVKNLQEIPIVCVSIDEQNQFADFVRQADKSKAVIEKSLKELETLQASLMQKYFS